MSLPSDLQHIANLLSEFVDRHDLGFVTLKVHASAGTNYMNTVDIRHRLGPKWEIDNRSQTIADIGHAVQDKIRASVRVEQSHQESVRKEIQDKEGSLEKSKATAALLRDLIPTPLIELAKCAAEEPEVEKEDLNWIPIDDDLPF